MEVSATWLGTASILFDFGGLRVLCDPAFDPAGTTHRMVPPGVPEPLVMRRTESPVLPDFEPYQIDLVLLTHLHPDHFDAAARPFATAAEQVVTTPAAARHFGDKGVGLAAGNGAVFERRGVSLRITAVPAQHGPATLATVVGELTGFLLEPAGATGAIWLSGDTVPCPELSAALQGRAIGTAFINLGKAQFPATGDVQFTMSAAAGARLANDLGVTSVVPVHFSGWSHFTEPPAEVTAEFEGRTTRGVVWAKAGTPLPLSWPDLTA